MKKIYKKINKCRISNDKNLYNLIDFNEIALTGIFPKRKNTKIKKTPLSLVFSNKSKLLQLKHNYNFNHLFGSNYGYRSGLNKSMVEHLKKKYVNLKKKLKLIKSDKILDIGSNDGTFLNFFKDQSFKVGCDPSSKKFRKYYNKDIRVYNSIFNNDISKKLNKKFKLISAIAMFYDLDKPIDFCHSVENILDLNGIFHVEVAYLPDILSKYSFDTFCQEHLTYFSYISFCNLLKKTNLRIVDYSRNSINGGSINFDLVLNSSKIKSKTKKLKKLHNKEIKNNLNKLTTYKNYFKKIEINMNNISTKIKNLSKKNKIYCFGASTKGNVTLQLCDLDGEVIDGIYDVNKEKFNCLTPGTNIKIKNEKSITSDKPDYILFLIWHFKKTIKEKFKYFNLKKTKYIWLFPKLKISKKI